MGTLLAWVRYGKKFVVYVTGLAGGLVTYGAVDGTARAVCLAIVAAGTGAGIAAVTNAEHPRAVPGRHAKPTP